MEGLVQDYVLAFRKTAADLGAPSPSPYGGWLGALGQRADRAISSGAAVPSLSAGLQGVGESLKKAPGAALNFAKGVGRDLTYGPVVDFKEHGGQAVEALRNKDWGGAASAGINMGLDNMSLGMNASMLLGGPLDVAAAPAKEGLMYGLRRLAVGGMKMMTPALLAGSPRAALTDGIRAAAKPVLSGVERAGGGLIADAARAGGGLLDRGLEAASGWIAKSKNPLVKLTTLSPFPAAENETLRGTIGRYAANTAALGSHVGVRFGAPMVQNKLEFESFKNQLRGMAPDQLRGMLARQYGEENVPAALQYLQQNGLLNP
jgi:hypothetical protein